VNNARAHLPPILTGRAINGLPWQPDCSDGHELARTLGNRRPVSGEERLLFALLDSAVADLRSTSVHPNADALRGAAREWIAGDFGGFTFAQACGVFGLDVEAARVALLASECGGTSCQVCGAVMRRRKGTHCSARCRMRANQKARRASRGSHARRRRKPPRSPCSRIVDKRLPGEHNGGVR
jgi:hypothetical protein